MPQFGFSVFLNSDMHNPVWVFGLQVFQELCNSYYIVLVGGIVLFVEQTYYFNALCFQNQLPTGLCRSTVLIKIRRFVFISKCVSVVAVMKLKKIELIDNHKEKLSRLRVLKSKVTAFRKLLYDTRDKYDMIHKQSKSPSWTRWHHAVGRGWRG